MSGAQLSLTAWFHFIKDKKKPPTKAVVKRLLTLAGFIKRSAI